MSLLNAFINRFRRKNFAAHETGRRAERLAAKHLKKRGYRIIGQNLVCNAGEIDILARDGETLVIVEVKALKDPPRGLTPSVHLNKTKRTRLAKLASEVVKKKNLQGLPVRFDLVSVIFSNGGVNLDVFTRAFDAQGRLV